MNQLKIAGHVIAPGERKRIQIDVGSLYDYTALNIPVEVVRANRPGPTLFISAAIHGDELNGIEIIKRILNDRRLKLVRGTLIAVPVVNVFGFINKSRYLPDRRDLNRCFPGRRDGSLASRLAAIFMQEVVKKSTHGIDLHTGAIHRSNISQVRACIDDTRVKRLAKEFGAPVIVHSSARDGSLREAARRRNIPILLFEGGQALRFEENVIRTGVRGCFNVMRAIGMLPKAEKPVSSSPFIADHSHWIRAPHSGSFRVIKKMGDIVGTDETLAVITDPFGKTPFEVVSEVQGVIIGATQIPLVNKGDAMFHIATRKAGVKNYRRESFPGEF